MDGPGEGSPVRRSVRTAAWLVAIVLWAPPPSHAADAGRFSGAGAVTTAVAGVIDVGEPAAIEAYLFVIAYTGAVVPGATPATSLIVVRCGLQRAACDGRQIGATMSQQPGGEVTLMASDAELGAVHLEWTPKRERSFVYDYRVTSAQFCPPGQPSTWSASLATRFMGDPILPSTGAAGAEASGTVGGAPAAGRGVSAAITSLEYSLRWWTEPCSPA